MRRYLPALLMGIVALSMTAQDLPVRFDSERLYGRVKWPDAATIFHLEGTVEVRAWVNREGTVTRAVILRSAADPFDSVFMRAVRNTRFMPRVVNGQTTSGVIDIRQSFIQPYGGIGVDDYELIMLNYTRMLERDEYASKERSAERLYARGRNHFVHGFEEAARKDFDLARSLGCTLRWYEDVLLELCADELPKDTSSFDSLRTFATVLAEYGLVQRAMPIFTRLLFIDPEHVATLVAAARTSASLHDDEAARRYYLAAYRLDSNVAYVANAAAWYCYVNGDLGQAIEIGRRALQLSPNDHNTAANLALYLLTDGQTLESTSLYQSLKARNDSNGQYILLKDLKRHIGIGFPQSETARAVLSEIFELPSTEIP